ncbi:hypothetical protein [Campylobacter devanensis]|uniref:hypothetical protein n=1 Tax=Campylobacter devanensis TaxID=3161138 RepID=UPI000A346CEC|nr:hypothetical protein [Campylobacter sp. P0187]
MEVKKYDKIILDSTRSIDDIVAGIKAELSKQESGNPGESYICYVSHAYSSGDNAGVNYIVVSDDFKRLNRLSSNVIQANAYTKDEINELIARVDAKIPVDEAKLAKQNELKRVEADILGKEQSIPAKRQELLTLNEQKRALEANLATITELIRQKQEAGENTEILQAQKRQYESDIATKSSQITNLEREINQLNSDIEVLNQTKERLKREEALIQSPELATKDFVNELKATLTGSINAKANSNAVVALTGNQTIAGNKTLSGATTFNGAITSKGANTFTGNNTFNTGQVTFNNKAPISSVAPTAANHLATKAYIDGINTTLTRSINTKANANAVVTLTGNQTIAGVKTFSSPVVVPDATANTHAVNLAQLNTKANQATTYTKTEVDTRVNAKANANAVVALTGNQTIAGVKTFSSPPISATNPTANNQVANKAYVDSVVNVKANANAVVALTGNQTIAGVKTFSSPVVVPNATADTHAVNLAQLNTKANQATTYTKTEVDTRVNAKANANATVNLTGNQTIAGIKTFSSIPVSATQPTNANQVANKAYVDSKLGKAYITETYSKGASWYRVWSDKWCEQGGIISGVLDARQTITFLKPFANANYYFNRNCLYNSSIGQTDIIYFTGYLNKTTSSVEILTSRFTSHSSWLACGYIN